MICTFLLNKGHGDQVLGNEGDRHMEPLSAAFSEGQADKNEVGESATSSSPQGRSGEDRGGRNDGEKSSPAYTGRSVIDRNETHATGKPRPDKKDKKNAKEMKTADKERKRKRDGQEKSSARKNTGTKEKKAAKRDPPGEKKKQTKKTSHWDRERTRDTMPNTPIASTSNSPGRHPRTPLTPGDEDFSRLSSPEYDEREHQKESDRHFTPKAGTSKRDSPKRSRHGGGHKEASAAFNGHRGDSRHGLPRLGDREEDSDVENELNMEMRVGSHAFEIHCCLSRQHLYSPMQDIHDTLSPPRRGWGQRGKGNSTRNNVDSASVTGLAKRVDSLQATMGKSVKLQSHITSLMLCISFVQT